MTAVDLQRPGSAGLQAWPLSVKAYHALGELGLIPEKSELLYGQVYQKMSKSPLHRHLCQRLLRWLQRAQPAGHFVWQEQPITCGDSEPEPDLALICGNEDDFPTGHPHTAELVIEVCVTSHQHDQAKLRAYATAGVKECWLVLGPEQAIEVYRRPEGGQFSEYSRHTLGEKLTSSAVPGFTVELDRLFAL